MACRCGSTSVVLALAGAAAISVFGLMSATGTSICSLFSSCDATAAPVATTVADTAGAKSCCPLGKTAQAVNASNTTAETCPAKAVNASNAACDKPCDGAAKAINASNTTCDKPCEAQAACDKPCEGEAKAINASASEAECPFMKAQQAAAAASTCEAKATCSEMKAVPASLVSFALAAGDLPVVTPVFRAECGAVKYDCSVRAINASNLVSDKACASKAAACSEKTECAEKAEAAAINAANTAEAKPCCQANKAKAVNASNTAKSDCKNLQDGCKGDGQNGCCGGCLDKKDAAVPAATTAAKGE